MDFRDSYTVIMSVLLIGSVIFGTYKLAKTVSSKYHVPPIFFMTAFVFFLPIAVSPFVLFACLFVPQGVSDHDVPIAMSAFALFPFLIYSGFVGSLKLYEKVRSFSAILPAIVSWILAGVCLYWGIRIYGLPLF